MLHIEVSVVNPILAVCVLPLVVSDRAISNSKMLNGEACMILSTVDIPVMSIKFANKLTRAFSFGLLIDNFNDKSAISVGVSTFAFCRIVVRAEPSILNPKSKPSPLFNDIFLYNIISR